MGKSDEIRADEIREHLSVIGEPRTADERAMVAFLRRELVEIHRCENLLRAARGESA